MEGWFSSEISYLTLKEHITYIFEANLASLGSNPIPDALKADIAALLADPLRAALASGEADTKPATRD